MDYYERAGLTPYLEKLGFDLVGFGCTTCIGNSGPLLQPDLRRGGRRRPGRGVGAVRQPQLRGPHQPRRPHELPGLPAARRRLRPGRHHGHRPRPRPARHRRPTASPCTCGTSGRRRPRWPTAVGASIESDDVPHVLRRRSSKATTAGATSTSRPATPTRGTRPSTYVRKPPYFDGMRPTPAPLADVRGARVLAKLGDSVTTDHISPAGNIRKDGPAGRWLVDGGVEPGTSTPTGPGGATTRS